MEQVKPIVIENVNLNVKINDPFCAIRIRNEETEWKYFYWIVLLKYKAVD